MLMLKTLWGCHTPVQTGPKRRFQPPQAGLETPKSSPVGRCRGVDRGYPEIEPGIPAIGKKKKVALGGGLDGRTVAANKPTPTPSPLRPTPPQPKGGTQVRGGLRGQNRFIEV